ncbi:hypothetical protein [Demequina sp. NBRC 110053]|uniref:hypothetical protein n=1 Tax=Demequina sp. NBRC 110053 TaxID=1570342 RepID=UPI000A062757|nr:hypothetical protein [Demequina sp. NBRC 110053]
MTTDLDRAIAPARTHQLSGVISSLRNLGLDLPAKHAKAIDTAQTLPASIAEHAPTPDEVLAAMEKALKGGKNPLDCEEARRYAAAQMLTAPDIAGLSRRRAEAAVNDAVAHAIPDVVESVRPLVEKAGEDIEHAFASLGSGWVNQASNSYGGASLAAWANGTEALKTLHKVAGLWGSIINLSSVKAGMGDKWLIFAEPDADHLAIPSERLDALWLVRQGKPVEMATLETLAQRRANAAELNAAAQRAQQRSDLDARTNHMNRVRVS